MFIATKDTKVTAIHEVEWQCRRNAKGLDKSAYWTWLESVTSEDENGHQSYDFSGEDYEIVECTDEDVQARLNQLGDYINSNRSPDETLVYNIKYYASKRDSEIVDVEAHTIAAYTDEDGNDVAEKDVATTYVQSHFIGDDTAKDARILADEWTRIRRERDRLLTESDWTQANDTALTSAKVTKWATYRTKLRDLPDDQSSETTYADITWPDKP